MAWRRTARDEVTSAASQRLDALARQWRPGPPRSGPAGDGAGTLAGDSPPGGLPGLLEPDPPDDPWRELRQRSVPVPERSRRDRGWTGPAVRALALLVLASLAVSAWWWWSGRPRPVLEPSVVLATGAPIPNLPADPESGDSRWGNSGPGDPASGTSSALPAPPEAIDVIVHVAGDVARPGLVRLPAGSRVADAIEAAGGVVRRRAADSVNLARILVDGEQILVGAEGTAPAGGATPAGPAGLVDLNRADAAALEGLPGVGPVLAARIVEWRSRNGAFRSIDELGEVSGIGDSILEQVRSLVRV